MIDGECGDHIGEWSEPMNVDQEAFSNCGDGRFAKCGDFELLDILLKDSDRMNNPLNKMCADSADIIAAKAVYSRSDQPWDLINAVMKTQVLTFSKEEGLACYDDDQPGGEKCHDYKVQYCCKSKTDIFKQTNAHFIFRYQSLD